MTEQNISFGSTVTTTAMYLRRQKREGYGTQKFWEAAPTAPRTGIFIGWRTISDGRRVWEGSEEGFSYSPSSYLRAALVVFTPRTKPVLVPVDQIRKEDKMTRPTIVCLCGSTRFYKDFMEHNYLETMKGNIVLSVGFYPHAVAEVHGEGVGITPEQKEGLDQLHLRKVELADEVLVLNRDGYIGSSTARELAHARALGKRVRFLEEEQAS